jgi:hypothetical protein
MPNLRLTHNADRYVHCTFFADHTTGTTPNPDEPHIALANRRGLVVSQSHFEVVDFGAFQWLDGEVAPRELYNWTTHPDAMAHTWQAAIDANKDKDMIWTVGLFLDAPCLHRCLHTQHRHACFSYTCPRSLTHPM